MLTTMPDGAFCADAVPTGEPSFSSLWPSGEGFRGVRGRIRGRAEPPQGSWRSENCSAAIVVQKCMEVQVKKPSKLVTVSERNLQNAAVRLLPKCNKLVSAEVDYLRRTLGEKATQSDIDDKVVLVRGLPWSTIVGEA
jgi:hypothetical protein